MTITTAIQDSKLLSFMYDGYRRTVEPHTYGTNMQGHLALRAYQVAGGSESRQHLGWKLFHVNDMRGVTVQPQTFVNPRPGYKRGDKAFAKIMAQL